MRHRRRSVACASRATASFNGPFVGRLSGHVEAHFATMLETSCRRRRGLPFSTQLVPRDHRRGVLRGERRRHLRARAALLTTHLLTTRPSRRRSLCRRSHSVAAAARRRDGDPRHLREGVCRARRLLGDHALRAAHRRPLRCAAPPPACFDAARKICAHPRDTAPRSAALPPVVALLDFADMAGPYVGIILMAACLCALAFAAFKYRETLTKTVLQLVGRLIKRKR